MNELGFWFALPRLLARMSGRKVRRAEWSRVEAYGLGWIVFLFPCVLLWRWHVGLVIFTPLLVWVGWLLLYFLVWILAQSLRRLGLYRALTNNPLQSFFVLGVVTLCALAFVADPSPVLRSLGIFWLVLLALNSLAALWLKLT